MKPKRIQRRRLAKSASAPALPIQKEFQRGRLVRDLQGRALEQLKCQLLGQQHVADGKMTLGHEAPDAHPLARFVNLLDIQLAPLANAVVASGVPTDHVKIPPSLELLALRRRQILFE